VVAISVAALPGGFTLPARWIAFAALGLAGTLALAAASSIWSVLIALLVSGCGIGAVLVALFSLGADAALPGRSTTALTTLQSALVVGQALATAGGGLVAQSFGAGAGFLLTAGITAALVVLAAVYRWRYSSAATGQRG
jgi:hypothetical protein